MGGFIVFIEWLNRLKVEFIGLLLSVGKDGDHLAKCSLWSVSREWDDGLCVSSDRSILQASNPTDSCKTHFLYI